MRRIRVQTKTIIEIRPIAVAFWIFVVCQCVTACINNADAKNREIYQKSSFSAPLDHPVKKRHSRVIPTMHYEKSTGFTRVQALPRGRS